MKFAIDKNTSVIYEFFKEELSGDLYIHGVQVNENDFKIVDLNIGDEVMCQNVRDKIIGFIPVYDENYKYGYRLILENHGTQSEDMCELIC